MSDADKVQKMSSSQDRQNRIFKHNDVPFARLANCRCHFVRKNFLGAKILGEFALQPQSTRDVLEGLHLFSSNSIHVSIVNALVDS